MKKKHLRRRLTTSLVLTLGFILSVCISAEADNSSPFSLTATPNQVAPSDTITVTWTVYYSDQTSPKDWIGLFAQGTPNTHYIAFKYTRGDANGTVTFTAPSTPGSYEFRYLLNNGFTEAVRSNSVEVQWDPGGYGITFEYLENQVESLYNHLDTFNSITIDAVNMYYAWYGLDGLLSLYEATGHTVYVDYAVDLAQKYIREGRNLDGDGYLDWYSSWASPPYDTFGPGDYSHYHVEWRAAKGIARLAALIRNDSRLRRPYSSEATAFIGALENFFAKWTSATVNYNGVHALNCPDASIARFGTIALELYKATGDANYKSYVEWLVRDVIKPGLIIRNGAYIWYTYWDRRLGSVMMDTSHGNDLVNFVVSAYKQNLGFDGADIQALVNTVVLNLWNGDYSNPQFHDYVDGSGEYGSMGRNLGGWIKLAEFDHELLQVFSTWVANGNRYGSNVVDIYNSGNLARSLAYRQIHLSEFVPVLISPSGEIVSHTPTFTWEKVPWAESYELWISRRDSWSTALRHVATVDTAHTLSDGEALDNGEYVWWVRAHRGEDRSRWSEPMYFESYGLD